MKHIKQIIFDADDTLWENNIYYIEASEAFFTLLSDYGFERQEVENAFDNLEANVVKEKGYGSHNFVFILDELYKQFNLRSNRPIDRKQYQSIVSRFTRHPKRKPRLFQGVENTLSKLNNNYILYILTKGDHEEQEGKIIRSGLHKLVNDYFVVEEKNDYTYENLIQQHRWNPDETCMVGNSPKSDINPALRNGMYAIHIPYENTWKLDDEPLLDRNGRLHRISKFTDLLDFFL
ncbi:MAG: HAD hydrolase-like protein [Caldithrix sp.]|nr:HAD hydrolase-like protein [Caldithrix sp.]